MTTSMMARPVRVMTCTCLGRYAATTANLIPASMSSSSARTPHFRAPCQYQARQQQPLAVATVGGNNGPTTMVRTLMVSGSSWHGGSSDGKSPQTVERSSNACWNCGSQSSRSNLLLASSSDSSGENRETPSPWLLLVCPDCGVLQKVPEHLNYFDLFGTPVRFKADLKGLAQTHKDLQRSLHPDKFAAGSSEVQKDLSGAWSPLVNEAYHCLKKPIRRAKYLLYLVGKALEEGETVVMEPNFLPEVVEINEEIDAAENPTDVSGLMKDVLKTLQDLYNAFEEAFDVEKDYDKAKKITVKMQYYESMKKKLAQKDHEMTTEANTTTTT